jgi:adenylate cyclase
MDSQGKFRPEDVERVWYHYLTYGDVPDFVNPPWYKSKNLRPLYRRLPTEPRCLSCYYPFSGFGGKLLRGLFNIRPSRLNPHLCNECDEFATRFSGGAQVDLTIVFTDVRGSTKLAQEMDPRKYSQLIQRYYNAATQVFFNSGAMIEKLVGDSVTAFLTPGFSGPDHPRKGIEAARQILEATGHHRSSGPWIPVGAGVHTGKAFVGSIKSDSGANDIVVLGDTANTGARLASIAQAGEVVISQETARVAGVDSSNMESREVELKGYHEPMEVWIQKV